MDVAIEVGVTGGEAERVFGEPVAGLGVVPAIEIPLKVGGFVEEAAGEAEEEIDGGVGFVDEVAVGIVLAVGEWSIL